MKMTEEMQQQKERIHDHIKAAWLRYAEQGQREQELDRVIALEQVLATINNGLEIGWAGYKLWEALHEQPACKSVDVLPKYLN